MVFQILWLPVFFFGRLSRFDDFQITDDLSLSLHHWYLSHFSVDRELKWNFEVFFGPVALLDWKSKKGASYSLEPLLKNPSFKLEVKRQKIGKVRSLTC